MLDRLRTLGKSFTVYGLGDVATSIISFLLLPLYARFLTPADYGAIGLLLSVEVVAKIVFRLGLDGAVAATTRGRSTRRPVGRAGVDAPMPRGRSLRAPIPQAGRPRSS